MLGFLVFWFIYTFVVARSHDNALLVIKRILPDFFALAVCAFIIIVICSGALPKFFRKITGKWRQPEIEDIEPALAP